MGLMRKLLAALLVATALTAVSAPAHAAENRYINERVYKGAISCKGGPSTWCWGSVFVQTTGPCENYNGCFVRDGKKWQVRNQNKGPYANNAQLNCIAGIALTVASFYYSGPMLLVLGGGVVTVWGCNAV